MKQETSYGIIPVSISKARVKVLLVHHKSGGHWAFPKGHQEEGETPKATAARELLEETSLEIRRYLTEEMYRESYQIRKKDETIQKSVGYFLAEVKGEAKASLNELLGLVWLSPEEVESFLTYEEAKKVWRAALPKLLKFCTQGK